MKRGFMQIPELQPADISFAMTVAFGIQQGIDTIDSIITGFGFIKADPSSVSRKKAILKVISIIAGGAAASFMHIDLLKGLGGVPEWFHIFVTTLGLAGGTEGVNSVLKYITYAKENKKNDAAAKLPPAGGAAQNLAVINNK